MRMYEDLGFRVIRYKDIRTIHECKRILGLGFRVCGLEVDAQAKDRSQGSLGFRA